MYLRGLTLAGLVHSLSEPNAVRGDVQKPALGFVYA